MQLSELVTAVLAVVPDDDYTDAIVTSFINEAVLAIATGVKIPGKYQLSPPLPNLYASVNILTAAGVGYQNLPDDYNRNVFMVVNSDGDTIRVCDSWIKFMAESADEMAGTVNKYSVNGNILHYREIPAVATPLTVHYYKNPDTLALDADIPSSIPAPLHRDLIVGYVCKEIFNKIELGLDGKKVDTANYENIFNQGLLKLDDMIPEDNLPDYYDTTTEYISDY